MRSLDRSLRIALVAIALTSLVAKPTHAQAPAHGVEGIWQGSLQGMLRIVFHIERGEGGRLRVTMDSPDQGATGLAVDSVAFEGDSLHLVLPRLMAGYAGRIEASGDSINGAWRQGGYNLPLNLKRTDKTPEVRRPQEPKPPYPYAEDTVRVENRAAGVSLAGTLTTPSGPGPFPCAVLITGSGPEDRDEAIFGHRPFFVLADHLTRHGIAVLRLDDRGVGASRGRFRTATSEDFASDILSAVSFLTTRPGIDRKHIGLIGHSEGGLIAPMVATRSKDVAFIVLMAGPGIPGDSLLLLQGAAMRRLTGANEEFIARESAARRRVNALIRAGADSVTIMQASRELVTQQMSGLTDDERRAVGDIDSLTIAATRPLLSPWFRFFMGYDPAPTLRKVRCPVLALNGSKDFQVPPQEDLAAIEAALKAGGNRHSSVKQLPGLNHLFQTAATGSITEYGTIEETIAPVALDAMSDWITAQVTARR